MATINCPICDVTLMESDPSGQMNPANTANNCRCDHDQILYIATDSHAGDGIPVFDDYGDPVDYLSIKEINQKLGTDFQTSVRAYYPITSEALISNMVDTWFEGCECFGSYDETGCYNCAIQADQWIDPVEIHLTTWKGKAIGTEHVVGFVGDVLLAFEDSHLQHGAIWTTDDIPDFEMTWKQLSRRLTDANLCTLNRRQVR